MERWDDLRLFLAVARSGTLSSAAEDLELNVSTVQRRVAAFEAEIDTLLFQKGPRGYQLTNAGEALLPRAEEIEESVLAASRSLIGHDQRASGDVRITAPLLIMPVLARYFTDFSETYERVRPILLADDGILDLGRSTDIALRATMTPSQSAVGRDLCGIAWGHYVSVNADGEGQALPWIDYLGMDAHPAVRWRAKTFPAAKTVMMVSSVATMHAVLSSSGAQGLLPCFVGDVDPGLQRIGEPIAENRLWLLIHADLRRSARVRTVVDFLVPRLLGNRAAFEGSVKP